MHSQVMNFGEYLSKILKQKNITVHRLAELTGTKSRNGIQRILKNESSIQLMEAFKDKLLKILKLTPAELEELDQAMEVSRVGKDVFSARKILLSVFSSDRHEKIVYHQSSLESLQKLFSSYSSCATINILIFDAATAELSEAIRSLVYNTSDTKISITHALHLGTTHCYNAAMFVSIFGLLNYSNYRVLYSLDELCPHSKAALSNFVVIHKIFECGEEKTDLIKFENHNELSILSDQPGGDLYRFFFEQLNKQKTNYRSLRSDYENTDTVDTIINVCDYFLYLETNYPEYMIKQNMCHKMIPPDILYQMFSDANFLGRSQDDPKIQRLSSVVTARFETFIKSEKMKVNLFTRRGLLDFVENRCLSDHCSFLRPFTQAEVKQILQFILKQVKENPYFKIYLLKDDYCIKNIEFIYLENKMFGLFESSTGYGRDYYDCQITEKPIIDPMDDFIKNELMKNHTFPESETITFLEQLISTF